MFYKKNDPLVASVKAVMEHNAKERAATEAVNEAFGITSRKALPHERQHEWDAAFKKALNEGSDPYAEQQAGSVETVKEQLKGDQHKIDHDKDGKIEASDFKSLRMKKIMSFRKKQK